MANILIANISTFSYGTQFTTYKLHVPNPKEQEITAYHTNESILKCICAMKDVEKLGGISIVYALASNLAKTQKLKDSSAQEKVKNQLKEYSDKTALEYYNIKAQEIDPKIKVITIDLENNKENNNEYKSIPEILNDICSRIEPEDHVFIDSGGGQRNINNVIQLLIKVLKYKEIKTYSAFYADRQNSISFITDTSEFDQMTELADAFNEFMTTGKADQLNECFEGKVKEECLDDLLKAMTEFSDKIRIGNIDKLDDTIKKLDISLTGCENIISFDSIELVVLKQFLPVIREKLIGEQKNGIDYTRIIMWCCENALIQQALTIFVEKIPTFLYNCYLFTFNGDAQAAQKEFELKNKKNSLQSNWINNAFYTDLLQIEPIEVIELQQYLSNKIYPNSSKTKRVVNALETIERNWPSFSKLNMNSDEVLSKIVKSINPSLTSFTAFINTLRSNRKKIYEIFGIESLQNVNAFSSKFKALELIKAGCTNCKYSILSSPELFAKIFYGYIYVKATRNSTNHASSDENLDDSQKQILKQYKYDFSNESLKIISNNIQLALNAIDEFVQSKKQLCQPTLDISTSTPTVLNIGDEVEATVISEKKVIISQANYEIQLVLDKTKKQSVIKGQKIKVRIQQISKKGVIIQVKLL